MPGKLQAELACFDFKLQMYHGVAVRPPLGGAEGTREIPGSHAVKDRSFTMIRHRISGKDATRVTKRKVRTYGYHNYFKVYHLGMLRSTGQGKATERRKTIPESVHVFAKNSLSLSVIAQVRLFLNLLLQGRH